MGLGSGGPGRGGEVTGVEPIELVRFVPPADVA
jgi:hypothetical protein